MIRSAGHWIWQQRFCKSISQHWKKRKEESKKTQVKEDLKKATSEEGSLFCAFGDEADKSDEEAEAQEQEIYEDSEADDGYGFEENDDDED